VLREATGTLFIRGRDRTSYLAVNSLNIVEEFNGRASAQFSLNDVGRATYRPNAGEEVVYFRGTDRLFGGFIQTIVEQAFDSRSELKINVTCVDYRDLADCLNGPSSQAEPPCEATDLDGDGSVTMLDFLTFQYGFTGSP